jgi:plasmid stabilization system protein ParE
MSQWIDSRPGSALVALELAALAEREIEDAADYYEAQSVGLGLRFILRTRETLLRIAGAPFEPPPWTLEGVPAGTRHARITGFRNSVIFVVEPRLVAVAVMHDRQSPTYWVARLDQYPRAP